METTEFTNNDVSKSSFFSKLTRLWQKPKQMTQPTTPVPKDAKVITSHPVTQQQELESVGDVLQPVKPDQTRQQRRAAIKAAYYKERGKTQVKAEETPPPFRPQPVSPMQEEEVTKQEKKTITTDDLPWLEADKIVTFRLMTVPNTSPAVQFYTADLIESKNENLQKAACAVTRNKRWRTQVLNSWETGVFHYVQHKGRSDQVYRAEGSIAKKGTFYTKTFGEHARNYFIRLDDLEDKMVILRSASRITSS